ncbi:transcriptional regulator LeuO [Parasalinivibrio latis]|uniref:transcriptional regulator LeuO n=1 Tax=Parasalinivibrio latis TaxID=2952610 RepID=UPI0030DFC2E3
MTNKGPVCQADTPEKMESQLRSVDLNLITVFDAVMQEQNITRAARNLGMSQPAVSNAVARLKVMFNDELFIRHGRGIQPTQRAKQLFGPIRQALQLIKNELPMSVFAPETSNRQFRLAISSPSDLRFAARILNKVSGVAPHIQMQLETEFDANLAQKLRYQEIDFVIDYVKFEEAGFCSTEMFSDDLVVVVSENHPRITNSISAHEFSVEQHAVLYHPAGVNGYAGSLYEAGRYREAYHGNSLSNILYVVSQSELVCVAPRWLAETKARHQPLKVLELPFEDNKISGYLSWHESSQKDKGHIWMRDQLLTICGDTTV